MGCIELILLTAKGIPRCRIIFPLSVNHFTAAFPDSYASDLLISPFFFLIYDIANHYMVVHRSKIGQSRGMLKNIEYFIDTHVYIKKNENSTKLNVSDLDLGNIIFTLSKSC